MGRGVCRSGLAGQILPYGGIVNNDDEPPVDEDKTVYVRSYLRFRFGRWEQVRNHFRGWPTH